MYNFREVIRDDRDTYKNFATGEPLPYWRGKIVRVVFAGLATALFIEIDGNFLRAIIAAYSILLGFSFSVLFNLANQTRPIEPEKRQKKTESLESELRAEKYQEVMSEIFHNVSYFMYMALVLVSFTLVVLICQNQATPGIGLPIHGVPSWLNSLLASSLIACEYLSVFAIYFLIAETIGSFFRVIYRVNYVFRSSFMN